MVILFVWRSRATVIAASSALFIVCLSGCDCISIYDVVCACGFTTDAPCVGFPAFFDPLMYIKSSEFHAAWKGLMEGPLGF